MIPVKYYETGIPIAFEGYATDYDKAIVAIEFSMDRGNTWTRYETPGATSDRLVHWTFSYTPEEPGSYTLLVRSVNEDGSHSPTPDEIQFIVS